MDREQALFRDNREAERQENVMAQSMLKNSNKMKKIE